MIPFSLASFEILQSIVWQFSGWPKQLTPFDYCIERG